MTHFFFLQLNEISFEFETGSEFFLQNNFEATKIYKLLQVANRNQKKREFSAQLWRDNNKVGIAGSIDLRIFRKLNRQSL